MAVSTLTNSVGIVRQIARGAGGPHEVRCEFTENGRPGFLTVHFGLNHIRGNEHPYFSLTCEGRVGRSTFGGADHDTILRELPELADLAALHLSDINGAPMHAEANGWYKLAGACGGLGERYHAGNAETYGRRRDPLGAFAQHCRISLAEAEAIQQQMLGVDPLAARALWKTICDGFRPRWKLEADAAIEKYGLTPWGLTE